MRVFAIAISALLLAASGGCSAVIWGNLAVLLISVFIFLSTISLSIPAVQRSLASLSRSEHARTPRGDDHTARDSRAATDRT